MGQFGAPVSAKHPVRLAAAAVFGTYEPKLCVIFRALLRSNGVAANVGANVRWHTLLMAHLLGEQGRMLAADAEGTLASRLLPPRAGFRSGIISPSLI